MPKFLELLIRIIPLGVLCLIVASACDFDMDELDTLKIGQSQIEVLHQLSKQNIQDVLPMIDNLVVIEYSEIDELSKLYNSSGICLGDNKGMSMDLNFDANNNLSEIRASAKMKQESFGIEVNQSKTKVLSLLKKVLEGKNKVVIANCIFNQPWVRLKEMTEKDILYLQQYSVWGYGFSDSYSHVSLEFIEGKLANIKYHWRPYELP